MPENDNFHFLFYKFSEFDWCCNVHWFVLKSEKIIIAVLD